LTGKLSDKRVKFRADPTKMRKILVSEFFFGFEDSKSLKLFLQKFRELFSKKGGNAWKKIQWTLEIFGT